MAIEAMLGFLPDGWETLTIDEIDALARPALPARRNSRVISSEVAFRALSIIAVVWHHSEGGDSWMVGGALALLIAAGYNSARFQRERLVSDRRLGIVWQFLVRFIVPYYFILVVYQIFSPNQIGLPTLLLVNNVINDSGIKNMVQFWFIQTLFHCQILLVALFYLPPVRHLAADNRWHFGLALLGGATAVKYLAEVFFPSSFEFRTDMWVYAFALGWVIEAANTLPKKLLAISIICAETAFDWSLVDMHVAFAVSEAVAILFIPTFRLWTPACILTFFVAQASYYIYLSQGITINILRERMNIPLPIVLTPLSIAFGLLLYLGWRQVLSLSQAAVRGSRRERSQDGRRPIPPQPAASFSGWFPRQYARFWQSVGPGSSDGIGRLPPKISVSAGGADRPARE
jgi:hypothetical protein